MNQKIATAKNMIKTAERLTDDIYRDTTGRHIDTILRKNHYPAKIIKQLKMPKNETTRRTDESETRAKIRCRFPNIEGLTGDIKRIINNENREIVCYNPKTLGNAYTRLKDKIPKLEKSNVIYKLECQNCPHVYIGQTGQKLGKRLNQHRNDCQPSKFHKPRTALANHYFEEGHKFGFDNVTILDTEEKYRRRLISEMVHIQHNDNSCNFKKDTEGIGNAYVNLIRRIPKRSNTVPDQRYTDEQVNATNDSRAT